MKTYALITEGRTDQAVIENILYGFLGSYDADINWLLPLRDDTDMNRTENFSNWEEKAVSCKSQFEKIH
ncbi:MAG: hypothetical protein DRI57_27700 [Deltaproteobacteria bacterium]|nr:MAG: hypothetical protein DRI57_27700 [Deltaproteobacteria bacterium]